MSSVTFKILGYGYDLVSKIENFEEEFIKDYIKIEHPQFVVFFKHLFAMLDNYSVISNEINPLESLNFSIAHIERFALFSDVPFDAGNVADSLISDYAKDLDFRTEYFDFIEREDFRNILESCISLYSMKATSHVYQWYVKYLENVYYLNKYNVFDFDLSPYFSKNTPVYSADGQPPEYDNIANKILVGDYLGTNLTAGNVVVNLDVGGVVGTVHKFNAELGEIYFTVPPVNVSEGESIGVAGVNSCTARKITVHGSILCEIPTYKYDALFNVIKDTIADTDKGTRPFEYQIVTKDLDFYFSGLFKGLIENFHPSGFSIESFLDIENQYSNMYVIPDTYWKLIVRTANSLAPFVRYTEDYTILHGGGGAGGFLAPAGISSGETFKIEAPTGTAYVQDTVNLNQTIGNNCVVFYDEFYYWNKIQFATYLCYNPIQVGCYVYESLYKANGIDLMFPNQDMRNVGYISGSEDFPELFTIPENQVYKIFLPVGQEFVWDIDSSSYLPRTNTGQFFRQGMNIQWNRVEGKWDPTFLGNIKVPADFPAGPTDYDCYFLTTPMVDPISGQNFIRGGVYIFWDPGALKWFPDIKGEVTDPADIVALFPFGPVLGDAVFIRRDMDCPYNGTKLRVGAIATWDNAKFVQLLN